MGNLAFAVTESDLRALFAPVGEIASLRLVTDRRGRPKGLAWVKLRVEEPEAVLEQLRGASVGGRTIDVWVAAENDQRARSHRKPKRARR
ncbi:MAG: RNA-binding protein [Chloroflexota bacterium]|nr:RNA-binding protein [Chloroflexota bacterium]